MSELGKEVVKMGLVPAGVLQELRRWGFSLEDAGSFGTDPPATAEEAVSRIENILQGEGYVFTKETDLDAVKTFVTTMKTGKLHLVKEGVTSNFDIPYGKTPTEDFLIPWKGENVQDLLTNGESYLKVDNKKVYFRSVQELFFGDTKAFMLCSPAPEVPDVERR